jgi:hypothetical protein
MIVRLIRIVISSVNRHAGAEFICHVTNKFGACVEETTASMDDATQKNCRRRTGCDLPLLTVNPRPIAGNWLSN